MATSIDPFVAQGAITIDSPGGLCCFPYGTNLGRTNDAPSAFEPVGGDDWDEDDDLDDEEDEDYEDEDDEDLLDEDEDEEEEDDDLDEDLDA